ncbi:MAG: DUF1588 domain-containing protein [Verrucomicrobiales bacterium]|nr:DUF1588 domain-containing protein [Verrucomicrobiales bacterium]
MTRFSPALLLASLAFAAHFSAAADPDFSLPGNAAGLLETHCFTCHDGDSEKGDVRLDDLADVALDARLELLNKMQEQLYFGEMPPRDRKKQPSDSEREQLQDWVAGELEKHNASTLEDKLRYPDFGNAVDHDKLFSGEIQDAAYTPARRWLVSPQIFEERVKDVFQLEGRDRNRKLHGVTNPFILPDRSGVRDYDNTTLDGGHLLVMLANAEWISYKQIRAARVKSGELKADEYQNPKDKWAPRETPSALEAVIINPDKPSDDELIAAIHAQFDMVLGREPTPEEAQRYLDLTRSSVEVAGNTEGLRQMLVSVLLESEFLYRLEFGAGEPDEHGRKKLAPNEAARAISYALGDRGPDPVLQQAAVEGRLSTKEDFEREVRRLLADETYYAGAVDPALSGKNMRSHETTHPKLVRFFREFFGYPTAAKIFKDSPRSDGFYQNPSRGTAGSPGFLIKEADRIVDYHLARDEAVFENLLTTDEYFVYHDKDNETGKQIIAEWTEAYEKLKDTDWKASPEQVIEENLEFIKSKKSLRIVGGKQKRELLRYMYYFEDTIAKGRTPFTTPSFAHGYTYNHSTFYNLPPTPHIFRYNVVLDKNFKALEEEEFWDYPVEQPFKIEHRKGILTHPAWLIAHSSNFHTDPIKRGRWIREKLLAGRVPDVPITVDAQVPEDPHKTFRERVETVTTKEECWKCHQHMNPLGLPFEAFDDFGRYRLEEPLEYPEHLTSKATKKGGADTYKTKTVSTLGELSGTGDPKLEGVVEDSFDLIDRLAKSDRARQSIIRHAFRFFLGRNERLSDSQTLIDADRAYVESGGSFRAVVVSLLTSDSFIYRK